MIVVTLLLSACSRATDTSTAGQVREFALKEFKNDTSAIARETYAFIDSCELRTNEDCWKMYNRLNSAAYTLHHSGDVTKSMHIHHGIKDIIERSDHRLDADMRELLSMYVRLGAAAEEDGMPGISLEYYTKGLNLCADTLYSQYRAILYNNIGVLYAEVDRFDKAAEYFNKALDINLKRNIHGEAALNYGNLAELYMKSGDIDRALKATQSSLDHLDGKRHPDLLASMRAQQGDIYVHRKQYDVAMLRFFSSLELCKEINHMPGVVGSYIMLGNTYLKRNMPDSAMTYAVLALQTARISTQNEYVTDALELMSRVQEARGDYQAALSSLNEAVVLGDSLSKMENRLRLNNWEGSSDLLKTKNERRPKLNPWIAVVVVVLLVLSAGLIIFLLRDRRRKSELYRKECEQNRTLDLEIDKQCRELASLSLDKIRVHEGLQYVCEELRALLVGLNPRETAKRNRLRNLLRHLDTLGDTQADEEFKLFFGRVHPEFYRILEEKYPELTPKDMRLCAFLYLGLTTKEIAELTSREVRSVESARNRLRKKMGLDLSEDLTAHLHSVTIPD